MKKLKLIAFISSILIILIACSKNDTQNTFSDTNVTQSEKVSTDDSSSNTSDILTRKGLNSNKDNYEIVIIDQDGWEICLNPKRTRNEVTSYVGYLWYQMGSVEYRGKASAVYQSNLEILTINALDSARGSYHITYSLKFKSMTELYGSFGYYEKPYRVNEVNARLEKGSLGNHYSNFSANSSTKNKSVPLQNYSAIHPKKARLEEEEFKNY